MHSKFGLFQMSSLSLCAALSKVNFVVYYNYKDIEFHDPNPPDFWETIHQDVVNHSIVHVVNTLVEDEWLYCFQDDYAVLGIPTKRLLLTVEDIKNSGLNVIINSDQKSFIEAYSNRLTEESKNALLVWN